MTEKNRRRDYSDHYQRDKFAHMKAAQRNRNERGQLAVKIVCGAIASFLAGAILIAYTIHVVTRAQALRQYSDIHGSARWAKLSDIKKAGLLTTEGVYVGEWKNGSKIYALRHNGPEHVLCYAPPRSGKGVGLVLPTMLTWPHS